MSRLKLVLCAVSLGILLAMAALVVRTVSHNPSPGHGAAAEPNLLRLSAPDARNVVVTPEGREIPLPFGADAVPHDGKGNPLKGALVQIGANPPVWRVTYPAGTDVEGLLVNRIHLVFLPAGTMDVSDARPPYLDAVLGIPGHAGQPVDSYGYRYSDITASVERSRVGSGLPLSQRFPGPFYATAQALANDLQHGNALHNFATRYGIAWKTTNHVPDSLTVNDGAEGSLYLVVVNDDRADMQVRGLHWCGDGVVDATAAPAEACDDGNAAADDGCTNTCTVQSGYTCTGSPSACEPGANGRANLYVHQVTPAAPRQMLGGTLAEKVLQLTFHATPEEDVRVGNLNITVTGRNGTSVREVKLYKGTETTPFATATGAGCAGQRVPSSADHTTFCASLTDQLVVRKGTDLTVSARPEIKTDDAGGVGSNAPLMFGIVPRGAATPPYDSPVGAVGVTSGQALTGNNGDNAAAGGELFIGRSLPDGPDVAIESSISHVVMAKIASVVDANEEPDGSPIITGPTALGLFTFTAAANTNSLGGLDTVEVRDLYFTVLAQNVELGTDVALINAADITREAPCHFQSGTIAPNRRLVMCEDIPASNVDATIGSGAGKTFALLVEVNNPKVDPRTESDLMASIASVNDVLRQLPDSHIRWTAKDELMTPANRDGRSYSWIEGQADVDSTRYTDESVCGNGTVEGDEECDDRNQVDDDDCSNQCTLTIPLPTF